MDETGRPDFSQVFEAYHSRVLAWAARWLDRDDAEDVSQEVFVKVARSLDTLARPSKLGSWIYTITLNAVRDAARARAVRPERSSVPRETCPEQDGGRAPTDAPDTRSRSPEESAIRREMIACYLEFVDALPPAYREVYLLAEIEELSTDQIAGRLGISPGNVKIRLHRARATLYEQLRKNCRCYVNARGELMGEPGGGT